MIPHLEKLRKSALEDAAAEKKEAKM